MTEQHPGVSLYKDRHGRERWRYRRAGRTWSLPQAPGHPEFEAAYTAAVTGEPKPRAEVVRIPGAAHPRSLRAAFRFVTASIEWRNMASDSRASQSGIAERFFATPALKGEPLLYGDMPIDALERRHVKAILARFSDTPHAAAHVLRLLRKLTGVALDQDWITVDPTYRVKFRPPYKGWKAWPADVLAAFEARWPIGSTPRLVYALALYQGHRRSDVATIKWSDLEVGKGTNIVQSKGGKALWIPMQPELVAVLEATPRRGETILVTQWGRPFSKKALGMRMQAWTRIAGIAPGHTLHGLRKTLGKQLAEGGATTRQIMAILGHSAIQHAELYTREAEQRKLANDGMGKLTLKRGIAGGKRDD